MALPKHRRSILAAAILAACSAPALAEETMPESFTGMFTEGKASFDFRYRFEYVDQENISKEAEASTLRSRLTFASAGYKGFTFLTEFDDVTTIGDDDYNSTSNGKTEYPVVADPEYTEVNQAWLKYANSGASGTYGRQRILHGNQRFIGGVGWRQNEQTYDGFRAMYSSGGLTLDYAYVYNVNRIFGPDNGPAQPGNLHGENHFLRADWKFLDDHTITGFAYLLDIDEAPGYAAGKSVGNSTDTYGLEYNGKLGPVGLSAAYATQSDAGDAAIEYDADYYKLEGSLTLAGIKGVLGYELLGSDNGEAAFKTPYATLHAFQGWADQFLVTPKDGVEDIYFGLYGALGPVKLGGVYHEFSPDESGDDYGSELDLVGTWAATKNLTLQLKYASFSSDDNPATPVDVDKLWMTVQFKI